MFAVVITHVHILPEPVGKKLLVCFQIGKGVLRIMKGDFNATADIIPADLATNMMIAVGWHTAAHK